jgi:hypothetical protein
MAIKRKMTVAAPFWVEFDVEAAGEPQAIYEVAPKIQALEKFLNDGGYTFMLEPLRLRRPRTALKAQQREALRRDGAS